MKRIVLLSTSLLFAAVAWCQQPVQPYSDFAATTGEYQQDFAPDEIYLKVIIRERDSKGRISIEEQQQQMIDALVQHGFDVEKILKIKEISSSYTRKGNMAYGRYEIKLSTPKAFFDAYAICDSLDLSEVSLDRIDRSDKIQLRLDAAAEAMKSARRRAEIIAATEGRKVGKCFYFADEGSAHSNPNQLTGRLCGVSAGLKTSSFIVAPILPEIGTVQIKASVQAKFELE